MPVKAYRVIDVVYDHQESFNLSETGVSGIIGNIYENPELLEGDKK